MVDNTVVDKEKTVKKIFPTYEVGSLPKLTARTKAFQGKPLLKEDRDELYHLSLRANISPENVIDLLSPPREDKEADGEATEKTKVKLTAQEKEFIINFNAFFNLKLQEACGLDFVYDGEAMRSEMYRHAAQAIDGFEDLPEMIRSREPDSWKAAACVSEPKLKKDSLTSLILNEFKQAKTYASQPLKVPLNDPYMIAVMSDNRYFIEKLREQYFHDPKKLRYEAKREFVLALARQVIHPQIEALASLGAKWIQLDAPAATLDLEHIPILVEGLNESIAGIENVKFSVHFCYPRRISLTDKNGYELLFPHVLGLDPKIDHFSLELANAANYKADLAVFRQYSDQRKFEIGVGVVDITLEKQLKGEMETPEIVRRRISEAVSILGDEKLVYVAPDCGLRQLSLERAVRLYDVMVEGAELARKG